MKHFIKKHKVRVFGFVFFFMVIPVLYAAPKFFSLNYETENPSGESPSLIENILDKAEDKNPEKKSVLHVKTPEAVKAIYMTSCVVSTPSFREELVDFIESTELNSVVIDIKDFTGTLSFKPQDPDLMHAWENARCGTLDMKSFIEELHKKDIYVIGRITVFQDPHMTKRRPDLAVQKASDGTTWKDFKGLSFTDPGAKEIWDYHIAISNEAYDIGFDELNYDYIRFPSDGPMSDISFPASKNRAKPDVLEGFFSYLNENMKKTGAVLSADLFGMTTTNTDDLNIGQVLERAMPYFDYIAPMVYPSHYPSGWNNFSNPNHYPYEVINIAMKEAARRAMSATTPVKTSDNKPIFNQVKEFDVELQATTTKDVFTGLYEKPVFDKDMMRPWLQDFQYGGDYGPEDIRAQIQATYDAGLDSWMFWDPANRYSSLRQVLKNQ